MSMAANFNLTVKYKEEGFVAPENFAMVEEGVYRSAFPRSKNIPFLRRLGLKSVISLVPEDYPPKLLEFYGSSAITLRSHGLDGNKWPFKEIDMNSLQETVHDVLNLSYRPLLIHCNKGKHRTGTVVGCLRKARGWALTSIFQEYLFYANPKSRLEDQRMIESFEYDESYTIKVSNIDIGVLDNNNEDGQTVNICDAESQQNTS